MAAEPIETKTNWNFLAHIIRDVFGQPIFPVIYGGDPSCLEVFRHSEHGLNFWMIYGNDDEQDFTDSFVDLDIQICMYRGWSCDFFIALNETLDHPMGVRGNMATDIKGLMKDNGLVMLVNPDSWVTSMEEFFTFRADLVKEIQSYSMFSSDEVYVYENL